MRNLSGSGWPGFERPLFSCRSGAKSSLTARCRSLPVLPPFPFFGDLQSLSSPWLGIGSFGLGSPESRRGTPFGMGFGVFPVVRKAPRTISVLLDKSRGGVGLGKPVGRMLEENGHWVQQEERHEKASFPAHFYSGLALIALSPVRAATNNLATDLCTSCTTAAQFLAYAQSNIPSGAYFETSTGEKMEVEFLIFNPDDSLASIISAHGPCLSTADGAPCTWDISWDNLTGTNTEEQHTFSVLAPSMVIHIPPSVATTFTGTSQASAVSGWLNANLGSADPPEGFVTLVAFPDGSSAEYQVTGTNPLAFSLVLDSGYGVNGEPENDSGEPVSTTAVDFLTPPASFNVQQQIVETITQEQKADSWDIGGPQNLGQAGVTDVGASLGGFDWRSVIANLASGGNSAWKILQSSGFCATHKCTNGT